MNPLYTCSGCFRHIKGHESTCPFCDTPTEQRNAPLPRIRRVSRSEWLALGSSLTMASCAGTPHIGTQETSGGDGAGGTSSISSQLPSGGYHSTLGGSYAGGGYTQYASGGSSLGATDYLLPADAGSLACGTGYCDGATQVCASLPAPPLYRCVDYKAVGSTNGTSVCTAPVPSCSCYTTPVADHYACNCADIDGGVLLSCHTCYGAPPARFERLAMAA